jgi:RNA polymerase sigma-70 factor (ECF subfamily)
MFSEADLNRYFRYALSLTGNEDDAFDLLQQSVEKYLRTDPSEVKKPASYFYRIVRNQFIDDYRQKNSRPMEEYDDLTTVVEMNPKTFEEVYIDQKDVLFLLEKLSPQDRELLYFWAVEEYTMSEISELLHTPKGTLVSRMHRLRKKLDSLPDQENLRTGS